MIAVDDRPKTLLETLPIQLFYYFLLRQREKIRAALFCLFRNLAAELGGRGLFFRRKAENAT